MSESEITIAGDKRDDSIRKAELRPLTERQREIVRYLTSADPATKGRPVEAAMAAGYTKETARRKAYSIIKLPHVALAIALATADKVNSTQDPTTAAFINRMERAGMFDISEMFERCDDRNEKGDLVYPFGLRMKDFSKFDTSCLQSLKIKQTAHTCELEVKAIDPIAAGRLALQHKGEFNRDGPPPMSVVVNQHFGTPEPQVITELKVDEDGKYAQPDKIAGG